MEIISLTIFQMSFQCVFYRDRPIIAEHGSVTVNLRGLEIMNDDPSSVTVLYAKVESDVLQMIADKVYQHFIKSSK